MAQRQSIEFTPITNVSDLYVGREYYLKMDCHMKYTKQSVRDIVLKDHKKGIHSSETVEEYNYYRNQIESWLRKGWLYDPITEPTMKDKPIVIKGTSKQSSIDCSSPKASISYNVGI